MDDMWSAGPRSVVSPDQAPLRGSQVDADAKGEGRDEDGPGPMPSDAHVEWSPWRVIGHHQDSVPSYQAHYLHGTGSMVSGPRLGGLTPYFGTSTTWERRQVAFWTDDQGRKCGQVLGVETRTSR